VYFDELDCNAEQAKKLSPVEVAKRYAAYKVMKGAGGMAWAYPSDLRQQREQMYQKKAIKTIKDRMPKMWSDEVNEKYDQAEADYQSVASRLSELKKNKDKLTPMQIAERASQLTGTPEFITYSIYKQVAPIFRKEVEAYLESSTPEEAERHRQCLIELKPVVVDLINANTPEEREPAKAKLREILDKVRDKR
jgi:hypothetical protein